jgi:D-sedoheptulose 7-phosphate isomerase
MKDFSLEIGDYLKNEIEVLNSLDIARINRAINLLLEAFENEKRIYIFGNGGSSATASHFTNDFNKGVSEHTEKKFNFICLNDNVPTMMAISNDIGFEEVFRFQLIGHLNVGDIVIAISGSGNSKNVLNAIEYAKEQRNKIIGITGYEGGRLGELADIHLNVPVNSMQITEDIHMVFDHLIMSIFYKFLAGKNHLSK